MNTLFQFNLEDYPAPQEVLANIYEATNESPIIYNILSSIGWANMAHQIEQQKDQLNFVISGLALSIYAINYINKISNTGMSRITLEDGTECIKQLAEKNIVSSTEICKDEKQRRITWAKEFLDIWKRDLEIALKQEGLLIE